LFSLEVHHNGFFVGVGENRAFIDEKIDWFDNREVDTWSLLWIEDFLGQLSYDKASHPKLKVYS
jgi:hypothetical protein